MITKAQVKHIQSLDDKKRRQEFQEFIVEGEKMVEELFSSQFVVKHLYALDTWLLENELRIPKNVPFDEIKQFELEKISGLKTPNKVLAIVAIPMSIPNPFSIALALDGIKDPGNLGSIIRIADWFGIQTIFCSLDCVDLFNAKVVQATMGSIFRVKVLYSNLETLLKNNPTIQSIGTCLEGSPLSEFAKIKSGIILIGSESHGISAELLSLCNSKCTIEKKGKAESLNAAVATGIVCHALL
jgi:TrmH family RNA methyltransferase